MENYLWAAIIALILACVALVIALIYMACQSCDKNSKTLVAASTQTAKEIGPKKVSKETQTVWQEKHPEKPSPFQKSDLHPSLLWKKRDPYGFSSPEEGEKEGNKENKDKESKDKDKDKPSKPSRTHSII